MSLLGGLNPLAELKEELKLLHVEIVELKHATTELIQATQKLIEVISKSSLPKTGKSK